MNWTALAVLPLLSASCAVVAAPLATTTVSYQQVESTWDSLAIAEAERQSTVSAQIAGRIVAINFRAGDKVQQGQVIMKIDPTTANQEVVGMQARVHEAEVQQDNARKQYERVKGLLADKYVSQAQMDKAEADFKAAQAQLHTLQANLGQSTTQRSYSSVIAPYSGVMSALLVEVGEMATVGKPLATGYDPASLRVTAQVPQSRLESVRRGNKAYIEINGQASWLTARSLTFLPSADPRTQASEVRALLPADSQGLLVGQFARVHFVTGNARRLVVPSASILRRSELTAVYVITKDNQPQLRQIRLGTAFNGVTEVLAGVSAGEKIALDPIAAGMSQ